MRRVVVDPRFPGRLRELRVSRGLSIRGLADLAHVSKSAISDLENARKTPGVDTVRALDRALGAAGELAGMVIDTPVGSGRVAYALTHPGRVDQATITTLARLLSSQRRVEDTVGATPMLPATTAQLQMVTRMVRETSGSLRPQLVGVAAQWAQFAGWLHLSADQPDQATTMFDRATEWAIEAGDHELLATVTSFRGHGAWLAGHVGPMIGLTQAALRDPGVYVGQRAYDVHQLARGRALVGDHTSAVELLAEGADLVAEAVAYTGSRPPWHYYRSQAFFDLEAGVVHALLGRVRGVHVGQAVTLLGRGLASLADDMKSADWTGMYRYHLGVVLIDAGDRCGAERELHRLRGIATATGSTRVRDYARSLSAVLTRTVGGQRTTSNHGRLPAGY